MPLLRSGLQPMGLLKSTNGSRWSTSTNYDAMAHQARYPDWIRQKVCWIRKRHFRSFKEIAETMDMSHSTVRRILREEGLAGPVSELRKERIMQYKADGLSVKEIASRTGVSDFAVRYALKGKKDPWPYRTFAVARPPSR